MTTFYAVENDDKAVRSVVLRNGATSSSTPLDLTAATDVDMHAVPIDGGTGFTKACTFTADTSGEVTVTLLAADLATAGTYKIEWQVTFGDGTISTFPDPGTDVLVIRPELG